MKQLSQTTLPSVNVDVQTPTYDRSALGIGVVHFGPGAFFRSHLSTYTEDAIEASGGNWGVCAVSINSQNVPDALEEQDGLYTLTIRDKTPSTRVIGAIKKALCARTNPGEVIDQLCSPETKIVTLTVTEKGYALTPNGDLDLQNPTIISDLDNPKSPRSVIGFLVHACELRHSMHLRPLTILSCDNISNNGRKLHRACVEYAKQVDTKLAKYIQEHVIFPNTMVDSITPAMNEKVKAEIEDTLGLVDSACVQREDFRQWVIEESINSTGPDWALAGAIITNDIHSYEKAKLHILNATHSSMAYLGLLAGELTVERATQRPVIQNFIDYLVRHESFEVIPEFSSDYLNTYWGHTLERYKNEKIQHYLEQIAHDGSQKLPIRLFPLVEGKLNRGEVAYHSCFVISAWIYFTQIRRRKNIELIDSYLSQIDTLLPSPTIDHLVYVSQFLEISEIFPKHLFGDPEIRNTILTFTDSIAELGLIPAAQLVNTHTMNNSTDTRAI